MMENVTAPEQYELLEMSRVSGFVNRAKGTGRDRKSTRLNSSHWNKSRMPSSA